MKIGPSKKVLVCVALGLGLLLVSMAIPSPHKTSDSPQSEFSWFQHLFQASPTVRRKVFVVTSAAMGYGDGSYGRVGLNPKECKGSISQDKWKSLSSQGLKIIASSTFSRNYQDGFSTYFCQGFSYIFEGPQKLLDEIRVSGE